MRARLSPFRSWSHPSRPHHGQVHRRAIAPGAPLQQGAFLQQLPPAAAGAAEKLPRLTTPSVTKGRLHLGGS